MRNSIPLLPLYGITWRYSGSTEPQWKSATSTVIEVLFHKQRATNRLLAIALHIFAPFHFPSSAFSGFAFINWTLSEIFCLSLSFSRKLKVRHYLPCLINTYNVPFRYNYFPFTIFLTNRLIHSKIKYEDNFCAIIIQNLIYIAHGSHNIVYKECKTY